MGTFINFSNHKSEKWADNQRNEALKFGEIVDIEFPNIDPNWDSDTVVASAKSYVDKILNLKPSAVLCQGEFSMVFAVVDALLNEETNVVTACSERRVTEKILEDGKSEKITVFDFVKFRNYKKC